MNMDKIPEGFFISCTHPFWGGTFHTLEGCFFNQKPDDFLFFFNSIKDKKSTQNDYFY